MNFDRALSQLTYNLIYPGVLGSMIFNLVDPLRGFSVVWLVSILICVCFVLDYLYLTLHLLPNGKAPNMFQSVSDLIIALLFCFSYFAIARVSAENFPDRSILFSAQICLGALLAAQVLILVYDLLYKVGKGLIDVIHLLGPAVGLGILTYYGDRFGIYSIVVPSIGFVMVIYLLRLVVISFRDKKEEAA